MPLVHLHLRRGEAIAEARPIEGAEVYFCAKDHCPHYQGQLGLLPDTATMPCALVQYPPDRTCQPYYLEAAEHLDQAARHQTWQERLDEAEAFEKSLAGASPSPERGECVWERGPGGEGPAKPLLLFVPLPSSPSPGRGECDGRGGQGVRSTVATILPFRSPSPAPRGRAEEGAPTQRRTTR